MAVERRDVVAHGRDRRRPVLSGELAGGLGPLGPRLRARLGGGRPSACSSVGSAGSTAPGGSLPVTTPVDPVAVVAPLALVVVLPSPDPPPHPARASAAIAMRIPPFLIARRLGRHGIPSAAIHRLLAGAARCYPRRPVLSQLRSEPAFPYDQAKDESPMAHLKPVPDPTPEPPSKAGGKPSVAELERYATVLRIDCVRMVAVAKSGHLDCSLSAADIVAALYYRVAAPRSVATRSGRSATASCSPRATRRRSSTPPSPSTATSRRDDLMGAAPDRLAPPGPPGHDPDPGHRGLHRLPRPGPLDERRHLPGAAARRPRRDRPGLHPDVRRRLPGGRELGGRHVRRALRPSQPDRDRRLQPPADRRHHRGGHGHRRRPRQVRVLRLGRGGDRRSRHGARLSSPWSAAAPSTALPRSSARPRRAAASPSWRIASAFTASRRARSRPSRRWRSSRATYQEQTKALEGKG